MIEPFVALYFTGKRFRKIGVTPKNITLGFVLVVVGACASKDEMTRVDPSDDYELREIIVDLVQSVRESSGCKLAIRAVGTYRFGSSETPWVQLDDEGRACNVAVLELNSLGRPNGISFISVESIDLPEAEYPEAVAPKNVDLIHEIDPQQEIH